jgi:hypothetical protein
MAGITLPLKAGGCSAGWEFTMAYDLCSNFRESVSGAAPHARHHAIHHVVGRVRRHARHAHAMHASAPGGHADACVKQAGFGGHPGAPTTAQAGHAAGKTAAVGRAGAAALPKAAVAGAAVSGAAALLAVAGMAISGLPAMAAAPATSSYEAGFAQAEALAGLGGGVSGGEAGLAGLHSASGGGSASTGGPAASAPGTGAPSSTGTPGTPAGPVAGTTGPNLVVAVPEPSSVALFVLALASILGARALAIPGLAPHRATPRRRR